MEINKGIGNVQVKHLDKNGGSDTFGCHHGDNPSIDGSLESSI